MKRERQHLFVARDQNELNIAAAGKIVQISKEAIRNLGHCSIALAGGSTPKRLYELLATPPFVEQIDWSRLHFFGAMNGLFPRIIPTAIT
ncbi:MAG: 6-phosphogluconolactonase [Bacteroidota bacterium]